MRTRSFQLYAVVSMLALLLGSQLCMLVDCVPGRSHAAMHACCEAAAKRMAHARHASAPAQECARPCCHSVTLTQAPQLEAPSPEAARTLHALVAAALDPSTEIRLSRHASPPGDAATPPVSPPRSAAGVRAPPLA